MNSVGLLLQEFYNKFVFCFASIRAGFWKMFLKKVGKKVYIMHSCMISSPSGIEIGDHVCINHHTTISGIGLLKIGSFVMIGPNCNILTANHGFSDHTKPMMFQKAVLGRIEIEDDVWLGANVVILPNVKIGRGAIIGANAVVTEDVPAYAVVGGVPAKLIKYRFSKDEIERVKDKAFYGYSYQKSL